MIKKSFWLLVGALSGQRCGRPCGTVCFNMSTWRALGGNIMDSAADVSLCLHALNRGWALWSKMKMHRRGFAVRASASSAHRVDQKLLPPPDFPRFPPAESTFCDQRHGNTTARRLDLSFCQRSLQPFGKSQWKVSESLSASPTPASPFIWHSAAFYFLITALLSSFSPAREAGF